MPLRERSRPATSWQALGDRLRHGAFVVILHVAERIPMRDESPDVHGPVLRDRLFIRAVQGSQGKGEDVVQS